MSRPAAQGRAWSGWRNPGSSKWAEYSRKKLEWLKQNPAASSREIDQAARRIAKELGL